MGSTYLSGTQTTFQFLDRTDFAVFVLAVDPPVGQQEVQLLSELAAKSSKILFVLNKKDYVDTDALKESVSYCQKVISGVIRQAEPVTIFPVSAKSALEGRLSNDNRLVDSSGFEPFEKALHEGLIDKKDDLLLDSAKTKIEKSAAELEAYIQLEINGLLMPLENLGRLKKAFNDYLIDVESKKRELFYVIQGRAKELTTTLDEDLTVFKKENESKLLQSVQEFADQKLAEKQSNSKTVAASVDVFLREKLIEIYSMFIRQEDLKLQKQFQKFVNEIDYKTRVLVGEVKQKASQLFGYQPEKVALNSSMEFETRFYYHLDPVFTTSITFSSGEIAELLPKKLFKGFLKKKLSEHTSSEFDKNGGRIRYDYFVTRLDQAVLKLKQAVNQEIASSTERVHQAVHEAEQLQLKGSEAVKNRVAELRKMQTQLQSITEQLRAI